LSTRSRSSRLPCTGTARRPTARCPRHRRTHTPATRPNPIHLPTILMAPERYWPITVGVHRATGWAAASGPARVPTNAALGCQRVPNCISS
jgi:hypothetical protein